MNSLWDDAEAGRCTDDLELRCYTSRLLGADASLVLHGGGNTSVKSRERNLVGDDEDILYVKGSGWDLATIQPAGFAPVRLVPLQRLAALPALTDLQMVNELTTQVTRAGAPAPSVEAILHAILPFAWVDHTHADAVLTLTNTADGAARVRECYGDEVVVLPYVMPGFDLARLAAERFPVEAGPQTRGMVLLNHGIFTFANSARESYERMIELVSRAEAYLQRRGAWTLGWTVADGASPAGPTGERAVSDGQRRERPSNDAGAVDHSKVAANLADLRRAISVAAGQPMLLCRRANAKSLVFCRRDDLAELALQGPMTPDHSIRTKNLPLVGRDVAAYVAAYRAYFAAHEPVARERKTMLDPAPRVVLDSELGMCAVGRSAKDAAIVADLYDHTIDVIVRATALGGYRALPAGDLFAVEYWDLEQAKLRKGGAAPAFAGEVALVTGAASGIGKACVASLLSRGAAVVALDLDRAVVTLHARADYLGIAVDVTDEAGVRAALHRAVDAYGGIDMLVLNAGIFPGGRRIDALATAEWRQVMAVNLDANFMLLRECHAFLERAPAGGRVVVIGSKNVPAPGPGAAAYSASKAALSQLARVAALEWGSDGIRVNVLHPNAVFDTALWTPEVLAARAAHYGMSIDDYKRNNVLRTEVTSRDVAELAAAMCGPLFAKTTGAQLPVDGGNDRVI